MIIKMCAMFLFELFVFLLCFSINVLCDDFCAGDVENSKNFELQFSKELSDSEYGIGRYSKSLHCCAVNYNSILWYKEDKLYPWKDGESNFVLDSKSKNQTLYVDKLSTNDAGRYSCKIFNNSADHTRHIQLTVYDREFSGTPVVTFTPPAEVPASLMENVKLYCETFVGKIDLPDAQNKIGWYKVGENNTRTLLANTSRTFVKKVTRDNGLTLGLYLLIENVQKSDYGLYICSVSNTGDQITEIKSELVTPEETSANYYLYLIFEFVAIVLLVSAMWFFCLKYGYQILLFFKPYVTTEKNDDNKEYDVFILFESRESQFVNQILIPTLASYEYAIGSHCLENGTLVNMECQARIAVSKTVLVVLSSPAQDSQDQKYFAQKLYTASNLFNKVICLLVQQKPNTIDQRNIEMISSMKHLTCIWWPMYKKDWSRLWLSLRLRLPVKRKSKDENNCSIKQYSTVKDKHVVCSV